MVKQVEIDYFDEDLIKARIGGYSIRIENLCTDEFSYSQPNRTEVKDERILFLDIYSLTL